MQLSMDKQHFVRPNSTFLEDGALGSIQPLIRVFKIEDDLITKFEI